MARRRRLSTNQTRAPRESRNTTLQGTKHLPDVKGIREVQDLLHALLVDAPEVYNELIEEVGELMYKDTINNIHGLKETTGLLESTVRLTRTSTARTNRVSVSAGGAIAPHAHLVEFGHRMISKSGKESKPVEGKKFMRNAFYKYLPYLLSEAERRIQEIG